MAGGLIQRDHHVNNPLDRIKELETRIAELERALASRIKAEDAGTAGATGQAWIEYKDPDGNIGYIRVYASK